MPRKVDRRSARISRLSVAMGGLMDWWTVTASNDEKDCLELEFPTLAALLDDLAKQLNHPDWRAL